MDTTNIMQHDAELYDIKNTNINWRSLQYYDANLNVNSTTTSTDSEEEFTDMFAQNPTAAIILLIFLFAFFAACTYSYKSWTGNTDEQPNNAEATSEEAGQGVSPLALKIAKMNAQERMELYNKAFDENKHQTVIQESSIIVNKSECNDAEDDSSVIVAAQDEDPSIYLALEEARSIRRSTILTRSSVLGIDLASSTDLNASTRTKHSRSSLVHPRISVDIENGFSQEKSSIDKNNNNNNLVRGNCVICFEDIQAGETVVWSEEKSCPHVYHKECMVAYLAHKKRSIKEIELDENPCPTCRRKFVTVCPKAEQ